MMSDVNVTNDLNSNVVIDCLKQGGIVVARTDTLYGVLALADDEAAVERVYRLKGRNPDKSPIVLIADKSQVFDQVSDAIGRVMDDNWPGPVSIIVPSAQAPKWLRRENDSVAYRLPEGESLRTLIQSTGPLIAPSANPEGEAPAKNVDEAIEYFGEEVDIYVDGGEVKNARPSKIIRVNDSGEVERLR